MRQRGLPRQFDWLPIGAVVRGGGRRWGTVVELAPDGMVWVRWENTGERVLMRRAWLRLVAWRGPAERLRMIDKYQ